MNAKRKPYNKAATTATPDDCRMTAEPKPTPPPPGVQLIHDFKVWDYEPNRKPRSILDRFRELPPAEMPPPPDAVERGIAQGEISRTAKLTDLLPQLKKHPPHDWYDAIYADDACRAFRDTNPRLIMRLLDISEYGISAANETAHLCPAFRDEMPTQKDILRDTREIELLPLSHFYELPETAAQAADGDEIARKVAEAVGGQFKDIAAKPRKDKGGKHVTRPKRKSEYDKTARAVADEFNQSRFIPERGAKPMGGCTEIQIKQWDAKYPDAGHPHPRWGYYADLRLRADLKSEYGEVLQNWARYWADYKAAFKEWRKTHPASRRESFRFTPMKKANGYNPEWIGRDENGTIYNAPTK